MTEEEDEEIVLNANFVELGRKEWPKPPLVSAKTEQVERERQRQRQRDRD